MISSDGFEKDTIAAIATAPGRSSVGIVRVSGKKTRLIAEKILGKLPQPRVIEYMSFQGEGNTNLDMGIALFFPEPHSLTGEDVLELQGHGSPVVLDMVLRHVLKCGARMARPGEFSERAFLNDKMDLAQAEAVADLIESGSEQAARSALRSLQGEFSKRIEVLLEQIIQIRMFVEAAIDFPEEEIDFLNEGQIKNQLSEILEQLKRIYTSANQGVLLKEGMTVVIAGEPNAGKSTLLNQLSGRESAIVTPIPGTTRDVMREYIQIDGLPLHIIDTAGLRETEDDIEKEGIKRAWGEIEKADLILLVVDGQKKEFQEAYEQLRKKVHEKVPVTVLRNKIDLTTEEPAIIEAQNKAVISISAKTGMGIELLKQHLKSQMGYVESPDDSFIARRRHLDALERTEKALLRGQEQLLERKAGELLAEELRVAQHALSEITGEFTNEDLLTKIFSSFCIGK